MPLLQTQDLKWLALSEACPGTRRFSSGDVSLWGQREQDLPSLLVPGLHFSGEGNDGKQVWLHRPLTATGLIKQTPVKQGTYFIEWDEVHGHSCLACDPLFMRNQRVPYITEQLYAV